MQFRPELATKIHQGHKWQTRRLFQDGDEAEVDMFGNIVAVRRKGRIKWRVGRNEAIQPGRGKHQICKRHVERIRLMTIAAITPEDAIAEGTKGRASFLELILNINKRAHLTDLAWAIDFERRAD